MLALVRSATSFLDMMKTLRHRLLRLRTTNDFVEVNT